MPKATRAKDSQETPKKRSRKTQPADGNGTDAVVPVTTAPAIAETTPRVIVQSEEPKVTNKPTRKSNGVAADETAVQPVSAEPVAAVAQAASATSLVEQPVAPAKHNGHVSEELVRRRAYELYLQRRGQGGSAEQDWFQALQEIRGQHVA